MIHHVSSLLLFSLVLSSALYAVAGYIDETLCLLILQKKSNTIQKKKKNQNKL